MSFKPYFKKISEELISNIIMFKKKYPETKNNCYPEELTKVFEKYIEVYGHAYCMDVGSERKKLSKLLYRALNEMKH
ncbi:MAG: hypothetical protein NTW44_03995 [Nitrospirae bacterium]|nr:hypothetical protein [Nitrospirota bacterium]